MDERANVRAERSHGLMDANDFLHELHFRIDEMLCDVEAAENGSLNHRSDLTELLDMVCETMTRFGLDPAAPEDGDPGDETPEPIRPNRDRTGSDDDDAEADQVRTWQRGILGASAPGHISDQADGARTDSPTPEEVDEICKHWQDCTLHLECATDQKAKVLWKVRKRAVEQDAARLAVAFGNRRGGSIYTLPGLVFGIAVDLDRENSLEVTPLVTA
jgi:hypothetical protein